MTNRPSRGAHPAASSTHSKRLPSRTPRDHLLALSVKADICPQVLLRVLGLVAQLGAIPYTIGFERHPRTLRIEIVVDNLGEHAMAILLQKVRMIVMVRSARLGKPKPFLEPG